MNYISDIALGDEFDTFNMSNDSEVDNISDTNVIVVVSSSSDDKLYEYYTSLKKLILNRNKVIIWIDEENKSTIRKQLCMLAVSYGVYDIYSLEQSEMNITKARDCIDRTASRTEVAQYIGGVIDSYDKASDLALQIKVYLDNNQIEALNDYLTSNREAISNLPAVMDFLKRIMDNHIRGIDDKLEKLSKDLRDANIKVEEQYQSCKSATARAKSLEDEMGSLKSKYAQAESDINLLKRQNSELTKQLSNSGYDDDDENIGMLRYKPTNMSQIRNCVGYVVYFKELSRVRYATTMIKNFVKYLTIQKKNVKFVTYMVANDYLCAYSNTLIVNGKRHASDPSIIANANRPIIVTDTNMSIVRSLLIAPNTDVLVVYDRLKQKEDLITGALLTKFYLAGDLDTMDTIQKSTGLKLAKERTFISGDSSPNTLFIPTIDGYENSINDQAKLGKYSKLILGPNSIVKDSSLFNYIMDKSAIARREF